MAARGLQRALLWGHTEITALCLRVMRRLSGSVEVVGVFDPLGRHPLAVHPSRIASVEADAVVVCEPEPSGLPGDLPIWRLV